MCCVGILMKARPYLTWKGLLDLYYSFTYPYLTYFVELWGHAGETFTPTIFSAEKNSENYNIFCLLGPYYSNFSETEIITFM